MEKQVTQKVEAAVRGVNGVDEIDSSVREGYSNTFIQFQIGTPTDRAVNDVRNAVRRSAATCPTASSSRRSTGLTSPATRLCSSLPRLRT